MLFYQFITEVVILEFLKGKIIPNISKIDYDNNYKEIGEQILGMCIEAGLF